VPKAEASLIAGARSEEDITLETSSDKLSKQIDYDRVLINSATIDEMIKVEGVSTAAASKIVANRESNGAFESAKNLIERLPALAKFETLLNERFNFEKNG
jgi:DNA uptake protein ComE-like DNA-binding protein